MNRKSNATKRASRILAIVLVLATVFSLFAVSASAYEVKGKTLAEVLGMDGSVYYQWLKSHEKDKYYNTTPYDHADHRNPNGDCDGAYGDLDTPGVPALNCMGFVWHALYMPTKMSGGDTDLIPAYGKGGWYGLYTGYNITRRYFSTKKELLNSGYAEAGDIIWMFVENELVADDSNHIAIYMGDGHSDRVWHAVKAGTKFGNINPDYEQYVVLKSGVIAKLGTPALKSVTNTAAGAQINWKKVNNATWYRVFVRANGKWKVLGNTKNNYFVDKTAKSGQKYTYTVRCVNSQGKFMSDYNPKGITNTFYAAPGGFYAECSDKGINFSWQPVDGASKYRVYRRTAGNDWEIVGKTDMTSFLDTTVEKGKPYLYTVRTLDKSGKTVSAFRTPLKAYIITEVPQISDYTVNNTGLTLTWGKIKGAEQYRVFKKVGSSWKKIGDTTTNSFTYKTPNKNIETAYTVRCLSSTGNAYTSNYDRTGFNALYESAPKINGLVAQDNGIELTWSKQLNAPLYRVYRKDNAGAWKKLGDTASNTYTDTTAKTGQTYTYTLRCVTGDGKKPVSGFNAAGWTMTYVNYPTVTAKATDDGIKVSWSKVKNATYYRVFVKKDGKWTGVKNTTENSYLFNDVVDGETYTFTVRCYDKNKWFNSFYNTAGVSATYIDPNPPTEAPKATEAIELVETGAEYETKAPTEPETVASTAE